MATLKYGDSCTIQVGQPNASVKNESKTDAGEYEIIVGQHTTSKQIPGGQTQDIQGNNNQPTEVKNIGKTILSVTNCN